MRSRAARFISVAAMLGLLPAATASAKITVSNLFTNHAILQRDAVIPVWGWAKPGESVTVRFAGQQRMATAGAKGKWMVHLAPLHADAQGRTMVISGGNRVEIHDVLVGDVWLCSGQSNMQFPVDGSWAQQNHSTLA